MKIQADPGGKATIVYRHHPADIAAIAIAVAVITFLSASRLTEIFSTVTPFAATAAGIGVAIFVALLFGLVVWGISNEHRLDAAILIALGQADENLQRLDDLDRRLGDASRREADKSLTS
jgi:hypothetical protein